MSRFLKFSLALLLPIVIIGTWAIVTYKPGPPGIVEVQVQRYTNYLYSKTHQIAMVQKIVHAGLPTNFQPDMSQTSFGDSPYYRTTNNYNSPADWGARPLPWPPVDLWCVRLQLDVPTSTTVVFVGEHQDIFNADLILHEPAAQTAPELNAMLARVGCDLSVTP